MSDFDISKNLLNRFETYDGYCIYLSFPKYEADLEAEVLYRKDCEILWKKDQLILVKGKIRPALWAQSHWRNPQRFSITSIGDASKILRQHYPRWSLHSIQAHRRCQLIQEQLRSPASSRIEFLTLDKPLTPSGGWTLEDPQTLWLSTEVFPPGSVSTVTFAEDKVNPPSRAYLKLWELFAIYQVMPKRGQKVIDMGSCPGGWSWVLQAMGCEVISVDKAPLAPQIAKLPRIKNLRQDAFTLAPEEVGPVDWFFSDIICYPTKLYDLVQKWRASGLCHRFICTIKFQGATDFAALEAFASIPNSRFVHLSVNKHEVTWICDDRFALPS